MISYIDKILNQKFFKCNCGRLLFLGKDIFDLAFVIVFGVKVEVEKLDRLTKYNVLYVEDEPIIRDNITEILSSMFNSVFVATNGIDALNIYKTNRLDLIITDINMPFLNGLDMVKSIREKDKDIEFILTTAFTEQQYLLDAVELNIIKYVVKPLNSTKLIDVLNKFIDKVEPALDKLSRDLYLDRSNYEVIYNCDRVQLTNKEYKFLSLLLQSSGIVEYGVLENSLDDFDITSTSAIHTIVKKLRKKLQKDVIVNIQGIGYKLDKNL